MFDSVRNEEKERAINKIAEYRNKDEVMIKLEIDTYDAFDYENHGIPKFNVQ